MNPEKRLEMLEERLKVVGRELAELKAAQAQEIGKVIRANAFIVEDENGRICTSLTTTKDGPALWLYDENGKPRASLRALKDGPTLGLFDKNGKPRAGLSATKGKPWLELYSPAGKVLWRAP
jgi:hypothetical protein